MKPTAFRWTAPALKGAQSGSWELYQYGPDAPVRAKCAVPLYTIAQVAEMLETAYRSRAFMEDDEPSICVWTLNWLRAKGGTE